MLALYLTALALVSLASVAASRRAKRLYARHELISAALEKEREVLSSKDAPNAPFATSKAMFRVGRLSEQEDVLCGKALRWEGIAARVSRWLDRLLNRKPSYLAGASDLVGLMTILELLRPEWAQLGRLTLTILEQFAAWLECLRTTVIG